MNPSTRRSRGSLRAGRIAAWTVALLAAAQSMRTRR